MFEDMLPKIETEKDFHPKAFEKELNSLEFKLDQGEPLPPFDLLLYTLQTSKDASRFSEPGIGDAEISARKLSKSWQALMEQKRSGTFKPESGWKVSMDLGGWDELRDFLGGWGPSNELGIHATNFIEERIKEVTEFNKIEGVTPEKIEIRNKHMESLRSTQDVITSASR